MDELRKAEEDWISRDQQAAFSAEIKNYWAKENLYHVPVGSLPSVPTLMIKDYCAWEEE